MTLTQYMMHRCHMQWHDVLQHALSCMDSEYINYLLTDSDWLPGLDNLFAAFSMPLDTVRYVLMGESPYPRVDSANGYAFWDNAVTDLWSDKGLSKQVNRATSLRNIMKMLLKARGDLDTDCSQTAIAALEKQTLVHTGQQFFTGMMNKGILLLNASLVYKDKEIPFHARHWRPFMFSLLEQLAVIRPATELILLGKIAEIIPVSQLKIGLKAEHPYNLSFINNPAVIQFFKPLDLLSYEHQ